MSELKARHQNIRPQKESPLEVVGAVIYRKGPEILAFQRSASDIGGGKWEFPGGKRELNESFEEALVREIREELGVEGQIRDSLGALTHHYPQRSIELHLFLFEPNSWSFSLQDHQALVWLSEKKAETWDWAEADIPWLAKVFATLHKMKI